ncbi:MAG: hypothetical protein Q8P05_02990 [Candidatus Diapherotrites archaeon]|nr:hypothetical protein [Candidatus Diapherotrites archaeon]MDZ4256374.1 hypothetical protein [archaeon]
MPLLRNGKGVIRRLVEIKIGAKLGRGGEGTVREAKFVFKVGDRVHEKRFVMKKAHWIHAFSGLDIGQGNKTFGNLEVQFHTINELIELNRVNHLGLRLPSTVALQKKLLRRDRLFSTRRDLIPYRQLSPEQQDEYWKDVKRQTEILKQNGYFTFPETFHPSKNSNSKKIEAIITDFGMVLKRKK